MNEQISALARIAAQEEHDQAVFQALRGWPGRGHEGNYHAADKGFETCPHPQCVLVRQSSESAAPHLPEGPAAQCEFDPRLLQARDALRSVVRACYANGRTADPGVLHATVCLEAVLGEAERPAPAAEPTELQHENQSRHDDWPMTNQIRKCDSSPSTAGNILAEPCKLEGAGSTPAGSLSPSVTEPSAVTETPKEHASDCRMWWEPEHWCSCGFVAAPPAVGAPRKELTDADHSQHEDEGSARVLEVRREDGERGEEGYTLVDEGQPAQAQDQVGAAGKEPINADKPQACEASAHRADRALVPSLQPTDGNPTRDGLDMADASMPGVRIRPSDHGTPVAAPLLQIEQLPEQLRDGAKRLRRDSNLPYNDGHCDGLDDAADALELLLPEVQGVLARLRAENAELRELTDIYHDVNVACQGRITRAEAERDAARDALIALQEQVAIKENHGNEWMESNAEIQGRLDIVFRELRALQEVARELVDDAAYLSSTGSGIVSRALIQKLAALLPAGEGVPDGQ